jgi:hypothetical protein
MDLKRLVRIAVIALPLSVFVPISQIANSNSEYGDPFPGLVSMQEISGTRVAGDRNISCPWGSEKVREGGNTSDSGWTLCVKNYPSGPFPKRPDAPTPTPTPAPTATATPSAAETRTATTTNSNTNTSDTRTVSPTPTPTSTPTIAPIITSGLGGYAVVHPDGHVCGVIVATSSDPFGNGGVMPIEFMGCPIRSRIVFQTTASSSGNVAGWHGTNVTESNGQFKIGGSTDTITVRNGVATNTSGQSWDTGNGAPAAKTTDTKTVVSSVDTRTATVVSTTDTRTSTTLADNKITSIITITSISNIESRTASAANLLNTYTSTEK